MRNTQKGFTLIELVVVIVILGILAVTALPKFIDLSSDAEQAATDGVAGALNSASAVNYGARKVSTNHGTAIANCQDVSNALQGGLPNTTDYSIGSVTVGNDGTAACTLNGPGSATASFTALGIS